MSAYKYIFAQQDPFTDTAVDENNRVVWFVNFRFNADSLATVEGDIAAYLQSNSLGTLGTDVFIGPKAILPTPQQQDPVVSIINYGGLNPQRSGDGAKLHNGSFQIAVRSIDYLTGKTRIDAIWELLDAKTNVSIP